MKDIIDAIQVFILCTCLVVFPIAAVVCTLSDNPQLSYFLVMFTGIVGVMNLLIMFDRNEYRD